MTERVLKALPLGVFGALLAVLTAGFGSAHDPIQLYPPGSQPQPGTPGNPLPLPAPGQPAQPGAQPAQGDGVEVLAKGPVHEAFATTAESPSAATIRAISMRYSSGTEYPTVSGRFTVRAPAATTARETSSR